MLKVQNIIGMSSSCRVAFLPAQTLHTVPNRFTSFLYVQKFIAAAKSAVIFSQRLLTFLTFEHQRIFREQESFPSLKIDSALDSILSTFLEAISSVGGVKGKIAL